MGLSDDQIDSLLRSAEERLAGSVASTITTASRLGHSSSITEQKASAGLTKQKETGKNSDGKVGLRMVCGAATGKHKVIASLFSQVKHLCSNDEDRPETAI